MTAADHVTVLRSRGGRLAKLIQADDVILGYTAGKWFDFEVCRVGGLADLESLLCRLAPRADCAVIRGEPIDPAACRHVRRLLHPDRETDDPACFREVPRHWLALDMDAVPRPDSVPTHDLAQCAALALAILPPEFRQASCIVQATGGHGFKPGARLRLWYWLARPVSGAEAKRWLRQAPVDPAVFRAVQPIYTAAPVLAHGVSNPCPVRLLRLPGPEILPVPDLSPPTLHRSASPVTTIAAGGVFPKLAEVLFRVRMAPEGQRHARLLGAAFTVGRLRLAAGISQDEASTALLDAVKAAGGHAVDEANATATIAWGLTKGAERPLKIEARS